MSRLLSTSSSDPRGAPARRQRRPRRSAARRHSRRALAWAAITFLIVNTAAAFLIDRCPRDVRFPEVEWALKRVDRIHGAPYILCYGSSRFAKGIRPEQMEQLVQTIHPSLRVVSGTLPAGDPISAEVFIGDLLNRNQRPQLLIFEISPETVSPVDPFMDWHITRQFTWRDILDALPEIIRSHSTERLLYSRLIPVYHHARHFRQWFLNDVQRALDPAWQYLGECDPTPPTDEPGSLEARRAVRWMRDYHTGGRCVESLERLLDRCRREHVPTILLGAPVSSPHRAAYTPAVDQQYHALMNRLCSTYGVAYIEFRDAVGDPFFQDHHHLTWTGSLQFSDKLTREVILPALAPKR